MVRLTATVGSGPALSYRIVHAWAVRQDECTSLFAVLDPGPLARMTVLLRERPFEVHPRLWVLPASAPRAVRIAPSEVEAYVLASDFTYDDLRTWTPRLVTAARHSARDGDIVTVAGEWGYRGRTRVTGRGRIALPSGLIVAATWTAADASLPFKTLRANGVSAIDGVSMPTVVTVHRPAEGYTSSLQLEGARVGPYLGAELFEAERIGSAYTYLADVARDV